MCVRYRTAACSSCIFNQVPFGETCYRNHLLLQGKVNDTILQFLEDMQNIKEVYSLKKMLDVKLSDDDILRTKKNLMDKITDSMEQLNRYLHNSPSNYDKSAYDYAENINNQLNMVEGINIFLGKNSRDGIPDKVDYIYVDRKNNQVLIKGTKQKHPGFN